MSNFKFSIHLVVDRPADGAVDPTLDIPQCNLDQANFEEVVTGINGLVGKFNDEDPAIKYSLNAAVVNEDTPDEQFQITAKNVQKSSILSVLAVIESINQSQNSGGAAAETVTEPIKEEVKSEETTAVKTTTEDVKEEPVTEEIKEEVKDETVADVAAEATTEKVEDPTTEEGAKSEQ